MTRAITPHKGGRTSRAPEARMTPAERGRLDAVLQRRGVKYIDWYIGHVNEDYANITGGKTMRTVYSKTTKDQYAKVEVVEDAGEYFVNVSEKIDGKWIGVDNDPAKFGAVKDAISCADDWFKSYNADTRNKALPRR